jgi:hypothetical protein
MGVGMVQLLRCAAAGSDRSTLYPPKAAAAGVPERARGVCGWFKVQADSVFLRREERLAAIAELVALFPSPSCHTDVAAAAVLCCSGVLQVHYIVCF